MRPVLKLCASNAVEQVGVGVGVGDDEAKSVHFQGSWLFHKERDSSELLGLVKLQVVHLLRNASTRTAIN